jgi:hypothetical protein
MLDGLCRCSHAVTRHVAGGTIPGGSLEHTLDMAGFAPGQDVRARQVISCLDMVKFYSTGCLRKANMSQDHQRQYQYQPGPLRRTQDMKYLLDFNFMPVHSAAP